MTASDKGRLFWQSNKDWYRLDEESGKVFLTDEAPFEALESFRLWKGLEPLSNAKDKTK